MIGIIMGPAGSGKGTQAERICSDFGLVQFSTGDFFRKEKKKDTERGRLIKSIIDKGNLVPDDITMSIVKSFIDEHKNVLVDGTPRDLYQAKFIYENMGVDFVVVLEVSEEEVLKRMSKRRICTTTGKIYISDNVTQTDIDECTSAGGEIIMRKDDADSEAIKNRLNIYHEQTSPSIKFYEEKGVKVFHINGEQSIDDVYTDIKKELTSVFS